MKKILILQMRPETEVADAEFAAILKKADLDQENTKRVRVEQKNDIKIDLSEYCAVIAGGSPFDLSTPLKHKSDSQISVEKFFDSLLFEIYEKDFPFLGACCGNGLLGKFCGVNISKKYAEAIGPIEVELTDAAAFDELLLDFPTRFKALVGHKEACDTLPSEATLLVTGEACPVQMFRLKNNIYATQFHPEADEEQFCLRIDFYKDYGYFRPEESDELKSKLKGVSTPYSNLILKRFVEKYLK
ncbi:MAG: glutamine amidotransferase [Halobacteriovoraceae bacterium]|nr:glutamine amidotransferase [Halobacteriovoraceae bacterium]|tara:strand:- start:25446 stop:26177 length:732 start_codon:yes stop_codon:yes gene_type:complete